jgi:hypothetical protein
LGPSAARTRADAPPSSIGRTLAIACAAVAPVLAALGDVATRDPHELREVAVGIAAAGDRSGCAPVAQLLVPAFELLPFGDREHRALVALAMPAALATFLVATRAWSIARSVAGRGADVIAGAVTVLAAVLLAGAPPGAALVVAAIELALAALATPERLGVAMLAGLVGAWASPRLSPALIVPIFWALRRARPGARIGALAGAAPLIAACVALLFVRDADAWLVLGRAFRTGGFAPDEFALLATPLLRRAAAVASIATVLAIAVARFGRDLATRDRVALVASAVLALLADPLRPRGAVAVSIALALPTIAELLVVIQIAVARAIDPRRAVLRFGLPWLVPALTAGFAARAAEEDLSARRRPLDAAAAIDLAPLAAFGALPGHPIVVVEDEDALVRDAWPWLVDDVRPDLELLPTQSLLLGGAGRMATRTAMRFPRAAELLRSTLAESVVTESGSSPLAADATLVLDLPAARLREVARHVDPILGVLRIPLERVDPSDRRLRRQATEPRQRFLDAARALVPGDPWTIAPRHASMRAARLLALASDRDAALAELSRARMLGEDPVRVGRWEAKLQGKRTLADEPDAPGE